MNEVQIVFSIPAASVNALDGTAVTLVTFPDDGNVRVPERLEIRREAGTAYTLTKGTQPLKPAVGGDYFDSYSEGFEGANILQVYEGTVGSSTPRAWFKVKADGLLDVATEQSRVVFPNNALKEFKDGVTSLKIEYRGQGIASGTGSLVGSLHLKEFGIVQPIGK